MSINLNRRQWAELAILVLLVLGMSALMYLPESANKNVEKTVVPLLVEGQGYTISEMLDIQAAGTVYLLRKDGIPVMGNIRLSQVGDKNILTGVTYHPQQLVLVASYESDGETLKEQVMSREKYPNVPSEISYSLFRRHGELRIDAWAMEFSLPEGTETIKMYSNG